MTILDLLRDAIEGHAERDAVVCGEARLPYRELGWRAAAVARALLARGVGSEQLVGVAIEPSPWAPIAMLGVLQAGAAFVPLDPSYPVARLREMVDQIGSAPLLLTTTDTAPKLAALPGTLFEIDREPAAGVAGVSHPASALPRVAPDALAYVIFTSGSTGRPKGVLVSHRGLPTLVRAQIATFAIDRESVILQFAPLSFDASISEVFTALAAGATLCLASRDDLALGPRLVELVARHGVTIATLPPSSLTLLDPADFPSLRTVVSAGEPCSAALVAQWAPGRRLVNAYGPTEVTVCATMELCRVGALAPGLGEPLPDTTVRILDARLRPVPRGTIGELYVAGPGVARGYLGRPGATADRFVPDIAIAGARMYRTGDLARLRDDGALEFAGRADHQVKLRGHRIELGEIEAVVRRAPGVRDALVLAREDRPGDMHLIAYVVGSGLDRSAIRAVAAAHLPPFSLPSEVVVLDAWPRTASGKIDRASLPAPVRARTSGGAPRSELEYRLVAIWEQVLGVTGIAPGDDFFELGGHSLLAIQMLARVRAELGVDLPLSVVTEQRTPGALARLLATRGARRGLASPIALRTAGVRQPLYLAPAVSGSALAYLPLLRRLTADRPLHAFHAPGLDGHGTAPQSFEALAAHYVGELLARQPRGPYLLGGWSIGGAVAFQMALQLRAAGHEVPALLLIESSAPNRYLAERVQAKIGELTTGVLTFMYVNNFARCFGIDLGLDRARFVALSDAELERAALRELRRVPAFPPDLELVGLAEHMAVHAATLRGFAHWHPARRYAGRVVLFLGSAGHPDFGPEYCDWSALVDGPIRSVEVPGSHFSVVNEPHVAGLAAALDTILDELP